MKTITKLSIACAALLLTSCGDSSSESSSPANANSPISVFTVEELEQYSCNKSQENTIVYIEEDDSYHTCLNEKDSWKWVSDKTDSDVSSSSTESSSSSQTSSSSAVASSSSAKSSSSSQAKSSSSVKSSSSIQSSSSMPADSSAPRFGLLKDSRDGQYYKTVTIGTQTWMAQNLNYNYTNYYSKTNVIQPTSWCGGIGFQGNKHGDCAKFGRLYTYTTTKDSANLFNTAAEECPEHNNYNCHGQGICPEGWHIPSYNEWKTLGETANIEGDSSDFSPYKYTHRHLLDNSGIWDDDDIPLDNYFKFNAIPSGYISKGASSAYNATFWVWDTKFSLLSRDIMCLNSRYYEHSYTYNTTSFAAAIRCIKDEVESDPANLSATVIEPPAYTIDLGPVIKEPTNKQAETYLNPDITYGEFTDERDSQVYKTVVIGNQTWMAQNLNYKINPGIQSWCGGGNGRKEGDCATYGRLYTWAGMKGKSESECGPEYDCKDTTTHGICPESWEVPSVDDFMALAEHLSSTTTIASGTALKANSDLWYEYGKGVDFTGFAALPAGMNEATFGEVNEAAYFWTNKQRDSLYVIAAFLRGRYDRLDIDTLFSKDEALSIRCIKKESQIP